MKLTGFDELARGLRELPDNLAKNDLRSAVAAGAAEIRKEVRQNALRIKDTGTLARSIYQKQIRELSGPDKQTFFVGARRGKKYQKVGKKGLSQDAFYAPFVEFGHYTRKRKDGKTVPHWVSPKPFMRPAFDTKKEAAVTAIGDKLRARIQARRFGK
jgi:HK97 gp10 family phage protein